MKQRKFKFSLGIKIASILSCLALVSIGFASWWVISIQNPEGEQTGSFTVYQVSEKNIEIDVTSWTTPDIVFGTSTKSPATTAKWLIPGNDETMAPESLEATLVFTVSTSDINLSEITGGVNVTFTPDEESETILDGAIRNGYIAAPMIKASYKIGDATDVAINGTGTAYNGSDVVIALPAAALATESVTVTVTFTFDWGAMTNGDNPFDYFNEKNDADTYQNDNYTFAGVQIGENLDKTNKRAALTMLGAIDDLKNMGYSVTIDATVKSAN